MPKLQEPFLQIGEKVIILFEERETAEPGEWVPYQKTTWSRLDANRSEDGTSEHPEAPPERDEQIRAQERNVGRQISRLTGSIRKLITRNEDLIVLAVVLLLLSDCEDDLEFLIAAAVLFYPKIAELLH